jgi:hypothetical protein
VRILGNLVIPPSGGNHRELAYCRQTHRRPVTDDDFAVVRVADGAGIAPTKTGWSPRRQSPRRLAAVALGLWTAQLWIRASRIERRAARRLDAAETAAQTISGTFRYYSRYDWLSAPARNKQRLLAAHAKKVSVARHMGPGIGIFARVMVPPNRQGHGARVAGDRVLCRATQFHCSPFRLRWPNAR